MKGELSSKLREWVRGGERGGGDEWGKEGEMGGGGKRREERRGGS